MSQSSITNINVTNTSVFINQVQTAGTSIGMGTLPSGASVTQAAQQFEQALMAQLRANFPTTFPGVNLPASNTDNGYMGPFTNSIAGTSPTCIANQITQDFSNWGLPTNTPLPNTIGLTVTNEMAYQGGVANTSSGTYQVTSNETIYWMAGYGSFDVTQSELGCVYVFAAALGF